MRAPKSRGHILLMVMIALAVLMVIVVGAIQFTGRNRQAAQSQLSSAAVTACAEAARQYLLGRLKVNGITQTAPLTDPLQVTVKDDATGTSQSLLLTGHYDSANGPPPPVTTTVVATSAQQIGVTSHQARDMSNVIADPFAGGQFLRAVVLCRQPTNSSGTSFREAELEFLFRAGF